jgi:hypothetical protein
MEPVRDMAYDKKLSDCWREMAGVFWPPCSRGIIMPDVHAGPDLIFQGTFWGITMPGPFTQEQAHGGAARINPTNLYQAKTSDNETMTNERKEAMQRVANWDKSKGIISIDLDLRQNIPSATKKAETIETENGRKDLLLHLDRESMGKVLHPDFARILEKVLPDETV